MNSTTTKAPEFLDFNHMEASGRAEYVLGLIRASGRDVRYTRPRKWEMRVDGEWRHVREPFITREFLAAWDSIKVVEASYRRRVDEAPAGSLAHAEASAGLKWHARVRSNYGNVAPVRSAMRALSVMVSVGGGKA